MGDEDSGWLKRRGRWYEVRIKLRKADPREMQLLIQTMSSTPLTNRILLNTN